MRERGVGADVGRGAREHTGSFVERQLPRQIERRAHAACKAVYIVKLGGVIAAGEHNAQSACRNPARKFNPAGIAPHFVVEFRVEMQYHKTLFTQGREHCIRAVLVDLAPTGRHLSQRRHAQRPQQRKVRQHRVLAGEIVRHPVVKKTALPAFFGCIQQQAHAVAARKKRVKRRPVAGYQRQRQIITLE